MFRPSFNSGSILKQNMLESLRDYPYTLLEVMYSEYGDGIISGFEIMPLKNNRFVISPGILKIHDNVIVSSENMNVDQESELNYVYITIENKRIWSLERLHSY